MSEVINAAQGRIDWVKASGTGSSWQTASAPVSGTFAFVRSMTIASGATVAVIDDRGTPNHKKQTNREPITVSLVAAFTGTVPTGVTGSGHSVPLYHLEYKGLQPEVGNGTSGQFIQIYGIDFQNWSMAEGDTENTNTYAFEGLGMTGPTGSGFLI